MFSAESPRSVSGKLEDRSSLDRPIGCDLVPEVPAAFKVAAGKAGIPLSEAKKAFLVQGDDRAGAVVDTVSKLAEAKINITATMATAAGAGRYGLVLGSRPPTTRRRRRRLGSSPGRPRGAGRAARG